MTLHPHPAAGTGTGTGDIEAESYRIMAERVDLARYGPLARAVVARVIHASADLDYAADMVVSEDDVVAGIDALRRGTPVITDVEMVRHGISGIEAVCHLGEAAAAPGLTRSAAAMRTAAQRHPDGAIVVVGCAPTALAEVLSLHRAGDFAPALVIGLPVGFVGAAEAKARLRAAGLPAISNVGEKGGSAVAAAALNAIARLAAGCPPGAETNSLRRVGQGPHRGEEGGPAGCPPGAETHSLRRVGQGPHRGEEGGPAGCPPGAET